MNAHPRVSLDQWRMLQAVVDAGGYAQAANTLHKSQSAVSYGIRRLEELLGIEVFRMRGRKAELTEAGAILLRRARSVLQDAADLECIAGDLAGGWEGEITIAVDVIFPDALLHDVLRDFEPGSRGTRLELVESVLSGSTEAITLHAADLTIASALPPGLLGEPLLDIEFACVAHPAHPLFGLGRPITREDLRRERQVVVRDSGPRRAGNAPWLEAEQRWTVSHLHTSVSLLAEGFGFAWVPVGKIARQLAEGTLQPLPLREGGRRKATLHLALADPDRAGPAVSLFAETLRRRCREAAGAA